MGSFEEAVADVFAGATIFPVAPSPLILTAFEKRLNAAEVEKDLR